MRFITGAKKYLYKNRPSLIVYFTLRTLVIISMVREFLRGDYHSVFMCALSLVLLIMPSVLSNKLDIKLPSTLEVIVLLFVFAAEILGELNNFYVRVPHWDTMLHTMNGFLCAAIGFALIDMMNREQRCTIDLSPIYLSVVAFCFSMTIGVLWEFFEFAADSFIGLDMQKDVVVNSIASVNLDASLTNKVIYIEDIADVIIVHSDGSMRPLGIGGYLDIGLYDTMKDLIVNLIGAAVFSVIGYFYVKQKGKGGIAASFIPQIDDCDDAEQQASEEE